MDMIAAMALNMRQNQSATVEALQPYQPFRTLMAMNNTRYCSFCGKSDKEVEMLVAGPYPHAICPECVILCDDIIKEYRIKKAVRETQAQNE